MTKYRAAYYYLLGCREPVHETGPTFDEKFNQVRWIEEDVMPSDELLPFIRESEVPELFKTIFPEKSPFRQRPREIEDDVVWSNHIFSLIAMVV